ncbi:hypothetical protein [Paraburkholderia oxyphila]|uniref:hypothetical protein n=1 Tax=Paraburkholderia oxyphila TaxID=614212 RepID=UPI0005B96BC0|nr:hypothetical protein [Paraburkholderia oxyphila]
MEFEFSWMAYFLSLFALMVCSIALTLLCPGAGKREDGVAHERGPDTSESAREDARGASQTADHSTLPAHPDDDA